MEKKRRTDLFKDKNKRYQNILLVILPIIVIIGIFGFVILTEVKALKDLASGSGTVKKENVVESMNYVLRDNATDLQKEYFKEMKDAIESGTTDDSVASGMICKNFIADFYTWTNKQGQYDVGGVHYISTSSQKNFYQKARDTFYKYINNYINEHGADKLIEVSSVEVLNASPSNQKYVINQHIGNYLNDEGEWYEKTEDIEYDTWKVTCSWEYKEGSSIDTSRLDHKMNFFVILNNGRFEIVEMSTQEITNFKVVKDVDTEVEDENAETTE